MFPVCATTLITSTVVSYTLRNLLQMANLSQTDRAVIGSQPLDGCLNHLRDSLEKVDQSYKLNSTSDLASELSTLFRRVRNGDFNYQQYRPLSLLVIKKAPDLDIWDAVFDLIRSTSLITPPMSIPPSFDGTPIIYSSASMQGDEQTKRLLENSLFNEIKNCTYQNVRGFFTKYFKGKEWSKRSKDIYQALKDHHVDN